MLATSVAVVRKMLEAVAGSAPRLRSVSGMSAPARPLTTQLAIIAANTTSAERERLRLALRAGDDQHADAGGHADERAVQQAEQRLLRDQPARVAVPELAEREAAQRHGERLAAGVARLAGEHRQEHREHHQPVDRALEEADDRGGEEGREQVELQPRVAEAQAARPGRREALLLLDADHRAGLRADLERLLLEERAAAHRADEPPAGVAHGVDREVARHHLARGLDERQLGLERERVAQHDRLERAPVVGEQQVAHRHDAEQRAAGSSVTKP